MTNEKINPDQSMLDASSRVALAAILREVAKFARRADIDDASAAVVDLIGQHLPALTTSEMFPFTSWNNGGADDSLMSTVAEYLKSETFMQRVIGVADMTASGSKQDTSAKSGVNQDKSRYTARQLTLLEQINIQNDENTKSKAQLKYRYALKPVSPKTLFPVKAQGYETTNRKHAKLEYQALWQEFVHSLEKISASHRSNQGLWLDHFETLWGAYAQAIPSATAGKSSSDVSLYDHSRTTAALATALWRYHHEQETTDANLDEEFDREKFLLIQGDFFGIQSFIFASGGESTKRAAKLLRGRSFYVSLLSECAALKVLDALELPATSQVINAAGKFLIVAPNTQATIEKLEQVQRQLDIWFLDKSWGQSGIGLAWQAANSNDFVSNPEQGDVGFMQLIKKLFRKLEMAKHQRLDLCKEQAPTVFNDYLDSFDNNMGVCQIDGRSPARHPLEGEHYMGDLAKDQMKCGDYLVKYDRLLISTNNLDHHTLGLSAFGYYISFTKSEKITGKFGKLAATGSLLRAWDFSLPKSEDQVLWNGYARRNINAYVARFDETAQSEAHLGRYDRIKEKMRQGDIKTLNHLALDDRTLDDKGAWIGETALMCLKGDIDNLGLMFQRGLDQPSFSKMATLSRQVNSFFAIYLPWLCQSEARFRNTYTVFAGGDDFFLIGPWRSTLELARVMREKFAEYVAHNPQVHFSVGLSMTKPGLPVPWLAENAEQMLDNAKDHNPEELEMQPKNSVCCFNESMFWDEYNQLSTRADRLDELKQSLDLSTGYLYGLLKLVDMRERVHENPQNAIWNSYFAYRTRRMLERTRGLDEAERVRRQTELARDIAIEGIDKHAGHYRVALFTHLYKFRH